MNKVNLTLWFGSLVLQTVLVFILFARRLARRVLVFLVLLLFYISRSVLLFLLPRHVSITTFGHWYESLSYVDLVLELLIAASAGIFILRRTGKWTFLSIGAAAGVLTTGIALSALVAGALPSLGPAPPDRGITFIAGLMLVLSIWAMLSRIRGVWIRIVQGFAVYGFCATVAGLIKSHAALHRDAHAFAIAVYAQAVSYLVVVVFWIFVLRPESAGSLGRGLLRSSVGVGRMGRRIQS